MQLCGLIVRWIGEDKRDISLIITTKQQLSWTREETIGPRKKAQIRKSVGRNGK